MWLEPPSTHPYTGYHLVNARCHVWGCETTTAGDGCNSCVDIPERSSNTTCKDCNRGFYEDDGECKPFVCETGDSGAVSGAL